MSSWKAINPKRIDPKLFNLPSIHACKIRKNAQLGDIDDLRNDGWSFYADLHDECPLSGIHLSESTWYLFAAK
jgi:hypothetical protein